MTIRLPSGVDIDHFAVLGGGFMSAKMLCVASELGIFEKLADGPLTLDELQAATQLPRRALRVVISGMVALDVLTLDDGRYANNAPAQEWLSGRGAHDMRPGLRLYDKLMYSMWMQLEHVIRSGTPARPSTMGEEFARIFSEGVEAWTRGGAIALAESYDLSSRQRLLDIGGGTGSYLVPLLERHPALRATLFDLPPTIEIARRRLAAAAVRDRIELVDGDAFFDPLPAGHDAALIAGFVHLFDPDKVVLVLRRTREAMAPGARLFIVDQWMDPTHTQPTFAAMLAGTYLMLSGSGDTYSVDEGRAWLAQTGWRFVEHKPLAGVTSVVVAEAV